MGGKLAGGWVRIQRAVLLGLLVLFPGSRRLAAQPVLDLEGGVAVTLRLEELDGADAGCLERLRSWLERPWVCTVLEEGSPLPGAAGGIILPLRDGDFRYTPPMTGRIRTLVLRVADRRDPARCAERTVRVLPPDPLAPTGLSPDVKGLIREYAPELARAPHATLPFLDPGTGMRSRPEASLPDPALRGTVIQAWTNRPEPSRIVAGYGLPVRLAWEADPGAAGQLLCHRSWYRGAGADADRLDVTGLASVELAFTEAASACTVESLAPIPDTEDSWRSRTRAGWIQVRGLLPLAGTPVPEGPAGNQDGQGVSARFHQPAGLALVRDQPCPCGMDHPALVVAEPEAHVLRSFACAKARPLAGSPGQPGHQDGTGDQARFNRPTHVAAGLVRVWDPDAGPVLERTGQCYVSDSGNHAVRKVAADGTVTTFAGAPALGPGWRDHGDPRQARFNNPQGIAVDPEGHLYLADQGNCVIRKIFWWGRVTTLAGRPGSPGWEDGKGGEARFFQLKGLAWDPSGGCLYVTDGHALRRVTARGEVFTVLGSVTTAGFLDDLQGAMGWQRPPCFRDPGAIAAAPGVIYIADQGNHAVRECVLASLALRTLAGGPDRAGIRWGLLRDGLEDLPEAGYGTLEAPRGLAVEFRNGGQETLFVATGPCLAQIPAPSRPARHRPRIQMAPLGPLETGQPCPAAFTVGREAAAPPAAAPGVDYHYAVAFTEADGSAAGPELHGTGSFGVQVRVQGPGFGQAGNGRVRVRCVTLDGLSAALEKAVTIRHGFGAKVPPESAEDGFQAGVVPG